MGIQTPERVAAPLTWREQLGLVAVGAWMVGGLLLDGWAHNESRPETIFTPWHAVFYTGFAATAWYTLVLARPGLRGPNAGVRRPLRQALAGLAVFAVGALGDQVWHTVFGIETGVDALLSPTHLVMLIGGLLILTVPFRAAWADGGMWRPALGPFLPALLSITLATTIVAFFLMYASPFIDGVFGSRVPAPNGPGLAEAYRESVDLVDLDSILITTVLLMAPLLLMLRRWRPPFGTATVLFATVAAATSALDGFRQWPLVLAAVAAGLATDGLIHRLDPSPERPWTVRAVAAAAPVALWLCFFAVFDLVDGVGWAPELWAGVTVMAGLAGVGLSLLAVPPELPLASEE